jgi:hypothetical protein
VTADSPDFDFRLTPATPFSRVFQKLVEKIGGTDWEIHVARRRPLRFRPAREARD